jgi:hypothetical protein
LGAELADSGSALELAEAIPEIVCPSIDLSASFSFLNLTVSLKIVLFCRIIGESQEIISLFGFFVAVNE